MNFLSPDDIYNGVRRKSLCNGAILTLANNGNKGTENITTTTNKKKERRRGSFNEPVTRRSSLVSRWFKHISDAAEQYKPRSKSNHEIVDDSAASTVHHSSSKETFESTPEKSTPVSMSSSPMTTSGTTNINNRRQGDRPGILDNGRDSVPKSATNNNDASADVIGGNVNRTLSTRSCEDNKSSGVGGGSSLLSENIGGDDDINKLGNLRHTQSARTATNSETENISSCTHHRDSTSIIYSNNSNNTRTLMQNSALVEPSAIQISISPAHTAEPVLTPSERLKRLDLSIRDGLVEKQRIICDMFRLPIEHFNEIIDIAAQPEAPKDSADIALAAYAQVQTLTELLNDYLKVTSTPEQQMFSLMPSSICDHCNQHQKENKIPSTTNTNTTNNPVLEISDDYSLSAAEITANHSPIPPPLPPPLNNNNYNKINQKPKELPPPPPLPPPKTPLLDDQVIHEDDDGYCEIDELRLPSLSLSSTKSINSPASSLPTASAPPPLPVPSVSGAFKAAASGAQSMPVNHQPAAGTTTPELVKRQSILSADSIPEESEQDITQLDGITGVDKIVNTESITIDNDRQTEEKLLACKVPSELNPNKNDNNANMEHIEVNDTYDSTVVTPNKMDSNEIESSPGSILCGPNRVFHARSLEPSVPCHAINSIVATLNSQISLLLPKINERDLERERLRRENQHLRELLNAMHERQRVETKLETPTNIAANVDANTDANSPTNVSSPESSK